MNSKTKGIKKEDIEHVVKYDGQQVLRKNKSGEFVPVHKTKSKDGYEYINLLGGTYRYHRIVWALVHGEIPNYLSIDHINGDRSDNRIENLRLATRRQNAQNKAKKEGGKAKYKGVAYHTFRGLGTYNATIGTEWGKVVSGSFRTSEEAAMAYNIMASRIFGEYARLNDLSHVENLDELEKAVRKRLPKMQYKESRWRGISWVPRKFAWEVQTLINPGKVFEVDEFDAATIYNFFAVTAYGDSAILNETSQPWLLKEVYGVNT
jgi:hypothetical protein